MTGEVRVVRREPVPEQVRHYPLATRSGIDMLMRILAADDHWRPLTHLQRDVLRRAYRAALDGLRSEDEGSVLPCPALPDGVSTTTTRALERRHLVADGRLTELAVEVVEHAGRLPRRIRRSTGDTVLCSRCFTDVAVGALWVDRNGDRWDVCQPCKTAEIANEEQRKKSA